MKTLTFKLPLTIPAGAGAETKQKKRKDEQGRACGVYRPTKATITCFSFLFVFSDVFSVRFRLPNKKKKRSVKSVPFRSENDLFRSQFPIKNRSNPFRALYSNFFNFFFGSEGLTFHPTEVSFREEPFRAVPIRSEKQSVL